MSQVSSQDSEGSLHLQLSSLFPLPLPVATEAAVMADGRRGAQVQFLLDPTCDLVSSLPSRGGSWMDRAQRSKWL